MRRNNLEQRRAHFRSLLEAEAALRQRRLERVKRRQANEEADELAKSLSATVKVSETPSSEFPALSSALPTEASPSDVLMETEKHRNFGGIQKKKHHKKKLRERQRKIRQRICCCRLREGKEKGKAMQTVGGVGDVGMLNADQPGSSASPPPDDVMLQIGSRTIYLSHRRASRKASRAERKKTAASVRMEQTSLE